MKSSRLKVNSLSNRSPPSFPTKCRGSRRLGGDHSGTNSRSPPRRTIAIIGAPVRSTKGVFLWSAPTHRGSKLPSVDTYSLTTTSKTTPSDPRRPKQPRPNRSERSFHCPRKICREPERVPKCPVGPDDNFTTNRLCLTPTSCLRGPG